MKRTRIFLLLAIWFIRTPSSNALEVFGNGNATINTNTGGNTFNANNAWALPFTTGSSSLADRTLQGAWVLVGGETNAVTFSVVLFDDAGTNGGPTGPALASGSLSIGANAPIEWRFVPFSTQVVLPDLDNFYVSVVEGSAFTGFKWAEPVTSVTPPVSRNYSNLGSGSSYQITGGNESAANVWRRAGSTWFDSGFTVAANPFGVQLVTVPEPSTYLLATIASGVVFGARRIRRRTV